MKILHITPSYWPATVYGGPTFSTTLLCVQECQFGHQVDVFTTTANGASDLPYQNGDLVNMEGVSVYYFKRIIKGHIHLAPSMWQLIFKNCKKYDVIHIHSWWNLVAISAMLICTFRRVCPFFTPHGMLSEYSTKSFARKIFQLILGKWLIGKSIVHFTSHIEQDDAMIGSSQRCVVLSNLVNLSIVKLNEPTINPIPDRPFNLLFLGRLHPIKRIELLIEALSTIKTPWILKIAGDGDTAYMHSLQNLIHEKGIQDRIVWVGWVSIEEKKHLFEGIDLMALVSHRENFAVAIVEGLAAGIPALVTDKVGIAEYIQSKQFGWVCPPDLFTIRQTLSKIISRQSSIIFDREEISKQIQEDFRYDVLIKKYIDAYQDCFCD